MHLATQRELAKCRQHRHSPRTQPVAPLRSCHGGRPRLTPRRGTDQAPPCKQGHPGGRTREEKRPNCFKFLVIRCPPASPLFASWPWPRHHWMLLGSSCSNSVLVRVVSGADSRFNQLHSYLYTPGCVPPQGIAG